ncbi:hypothetical protein DXG01_011279 [Tephrocybe rancida]|nr:hypothetical protein DXG01_011279 [Tephrocybe rancida]
MPIELIPLSLPASADASKFVNFGREVRGVNPGSLDPKEFAEVQQALYKHDVLLFRDASLTPEQQYAFTRAFDPQSSDNYTHGNTNNQNKSVLHSTLKAVPRLPQVQLRGHGTVTNHEGIPSMTLQHPSHNTFHKTRVSPEDEENGITRFQRWHMDAALYDLEPSKVTTLYGVFIPQGDAQVCRYDDGTGDELQVSLGTTALVSGGTMFDILPGEYKSLAVRMRVKYAPHPYVWMASARAVSTGLGMVSEGLEPALNELPPWEEGQCKTYPVLWKNPVTDSLHFQVHPCAAMELLIEPFRQDAKQEGALYPDGAHLTDLKEMRDLLYKMQRPGIAPQLVYPHPWREKDLVLFHNRGVMHSVVGVFLKNEVRLLHQCNLAGSVEPVGPSREDVEKWSQIRIMFAKNECTFYLNLDSDSPALRNVDHSTATRKSRMTLKNLSRAMQFQSVTALLAIATSAFAGTISAPPVVPGKWLSVDTGISETGNTTALSSHAGTEVITCYNRGTKADRAPIISVIDDWCK